MVPQSPKRVMRNCIFGMVNPLPNLAPSWNVASIQGAAGARHPVVSSRT
jgi:hypothetical protein